MTAVPEFVMHTTHGVGWHCPDLGTVSFFDSPALALHEIPAQLTDFTPYRLEPQQRVWWFDGARWRTGRVNTPFDDDALEYYIDFPNGESTRIRAIEIRVRWRHPINDSLGILKAQAVETRFFHSSRSRFLHNVTAQRASCQAMGGILSAGVELHSHQITAVRQVLQDPVRRYLLADEVGLGKTIEAGMIARQLMIERPGGVLVIAPTSLTSQWDRELDNKFRFDSFGGYAEVVSYSEIDEVEIEPRRLLIVDEAHRLATWGLEDFTASEAYQKVLQLGRSSDALLLLSATPVRSNEDGFLRLLHLLDPEAYPLHDIELFRERVHMRDDLASVMSELNPDLPIAFLDDGVRRTLELVGDDPAIAELGTAFFRAFSNGDEVEGATAVRRLRFHLSESYRIHRRMIRNRRTNSLMETFPVRGRKKADEWLVVDEDERRQELPALLDEIRFLLHSLEYPAARTALRVIVSRMGGPIEFLLEYGQALLGGDKSGLDADELRSLTELAGSEVGTQVGTLIMGLEALPTGSTRFDAIVQWARSRVGRSQVAIACSSTFIASQIADSLRERLGDHRVAEITDRLSVSRRNAETERFSSSPEKQCTVLVIDRSAEEGLNLQTAEQLLHVDLVASTGRIEQRIGRFDRWSNQSYEPIASYAFREATESLDAELSAWRRVLDEAFGVFSNSTATLLHVLPSFEDRFLDQVLEFGLSASVTDLHEIGLEVERQRRLITNQDMLDSLQDGNEDVNLIEEIGALDSRPDEIGHSLKDYAVDVLQLNISGIGIPSGGRRSDHRLPLVPRSVANYIVGLSLAGASSRKDYTSRRTEAVRSGRRLIRYGEPLVDRLLEFAISDDRGRAFITETPVPGRQYDHDPLFLFLFDFKIEPSVEAMSELPPSTRLSALSIAQRFMPAKFERVLQLDGYENVDEKQMAKFLELSSINLASRPDRLEELLVGVDWLATCDRRYESALVSVRERLSKRDDIGAALRRFDRFDAQEESIRERRESLGFEDSSAPEEFKKSIRTAMESPELILDSCGVLILTGDLTR